MSLLELAARVEAATGPDDDLFHAAYWAIHDENPSPMGRYWSLLEAGAYLDAAMLLVPEGAGVRLDRYWIAAAEGPVWMASICTGGVPENPRKVYGVWDIATPALALCAAALRSRASGEAK